jgi:kynurenine formamidase
MDLTKFFGEAVVVRVTDKQAKEQIVMKDMEPYINKITGKKIVLFNTNWYKKAGTDAFFEHPYVSKEVAEYLIKAGVEMICIDTINADQTGGTEFPVHDLFAAERQMIGENMAYFDKIDFDNPVIAAFPLKLIDCDGSPVRAVAMDIECSADASIIDALSL